MSIADRLVTGSLWVSLSRVIVNGLSTLSTIILAWYLLPSDFGLVALATTMLAIVTTITELSLNEALIRHEAPEESHFSAAWTLAATRGLILCALFAAFAYPASLIYDEPRLFDVLLVLSLSLLINGFANPRRIMLQRELIFRQEFVLNVAQKIAGFVATVAIAVIYQTYWALVVGTLVMQITNVVASYFILPFRPRITFSHMREFFSFSIWITAGQIVNTLNWRFDYLLIGKLLPGSALGYYSLGGQLAMTPTREATAPLTATIYPAFANVRHDPARLAAAYQRAQALLTAVALPAGIGMAVIADPLVRLVLGEKWLPVIFIIQALASVYALQTLGSLNQPLGMALGQTRTLFIRDAQMLLVRIPVITIGLVFWGLPGLIFSRVLTGLFSAFVNMLIVKRFIDVSVSAQLWANFRALASSAVMAVGVALTDRYMGVETTHTGLVLQLAALICLGGVLYCGSSLFLWLVMDRPNGPETEVRKIAAKVLSKVSHA
ncbi:lipopolysaccharide biosynthesis protein [Neorhizobium galegae]|uniref:lipopolysaccharide biosynthesis protein n=1 Tax=Neorhizobium galegae TaxID=399 RepID=UPI0021033717|nr:lipopolysaccharide biosynthesis protein [Neorhizobium galegae]MCQ1780470.1 lipopolysaccharide biosynthesis protein [Neorhizobium galegae]MCQ1797650.1 lipopolysaccharide biosynthesis protein [Neorhizobium galegae]